MSELRLFLDLLDREYLSAAVREKKTHLSNILNRVLSDRGEATTTGKFRLIEVKKNPQIIYIVIF